MPVVFPRYPGTVRLQFARVAAALLKYDQFDDWLPDPIYYQDRANDEAAMVKRAETAWNASAPAKFEAEVVQYPPSHSGL